ncbi:MAG: prepilin-type N-terminal cleavage/methylation domain-containing protein [Methylotenera sp.]|nr:prepilin-type N-terminal cleavage/methylation domain-containing protein [Oligoflexia bacterium]
MNSNSPSKGLLRTAGFTLIEVLIAITLLVVISLAIYQATTQTYKLRDTLMNEGDFHNGIRLSMAIMERDVSQIFSPTIMLPPKKPDKNAALPGQNAPLDPELEQIVNSDLGRTTQFWLGMTDKTGVRASRFDGTANSMSFISLSHVRVYKESPESEITKVTYELRDDPTPDKKESTKMLVKIEDTNAFDDESKKTTYQRVLPLLRGIRKMSFRYYRKEKQEWFTSFTNDKDDLRGKFPDMIEVSLEAIGPSRMFFEGNFIFKPEIPLNGLNPSY